MKHKLGNRLYVEEPFNWGNVIAFVLAMGLVLCVIAIGLSVGEHASWTAK